MVVVVVVVRRLLLRLWRCCGGMSRSGWPVALSENLDSLLVSDQAALSSSVVSPTLIHQWHLTYQKSKKTSSFSDLGSRPTGGTSIPTSTISKVQKIHALSGR